MRLKSNRFKRNRSKSSIIWPQKMKNMLKLKWGYPNKTNHTTWTESLKWRESCPKLMPVWPRRQKNTTNSKRSMPNSMKTWLLFSRKTSSSKKSGLNSKRKTPIFFKDSPRLNIKSRSRSQLKNMSISMARKIFLLPKVQRKPDPLLCTNINSKISSFKTIRHSSKWF